MHCMVNLTFTAKELTEADILESSLGNYCPGWCLLIGNYKHTLQKGSSVCLYLLSREMPNLMIVDW